MELKDYELVSLQTQETFLFDLITNFWKLSSLPVLKICNSVMFIKKYLHLPSGAENNS